MTLVLAVHQALRNEAPHQLRRCRGGEILIRLFNRRVCRLQIRAPPRNLCFGVVGSPARRGEFGIGLFETTRLGLPDPFAQRLQNVEGAIGGADMPFGPGDRHADGAEQRNGRGGDLTNRCRNRPGIHQQGDQSNNHKQKQANDARHRDPVAAFELHIGEPAHGRSPALDAGMHFSEQLLDGSCFLLESRGRLRRVLPGVHEQGRLVREFWPPRYSAAFVTLSPTLTIQACASFGSGGASFSSAIARISPMTSIA